MTNRGVLPIHARLNLWLHLDLERKFCQDPLRKPYGPMLFPIFVAGKVVPSLGLSRIFGNRLAIHP